MQVGPLKDSELVEYVKKKSAGWEEALSEIMKRYKNSLYAFIYSLLRDKHLSEDKLQETFIKFYIAIQSFDSSKKISTWLFKISHNLCIDYFRKKKEYASEDSTVFEKSDSDRDSTAEEVRFVIEKLDLESRSMLLLRDALGFDYEEISKIMGIPLGTVKSRISRSRNKFKELWISLMAEK
ncbi:MAG: RNA polymerase sigma factor [Planctomycetes bacterium]|nr:RNA polymerase sigma factor [Planctomycetota bacterium]